MATYNFADGGEIFLNSTLKRVINGPATFTPNAEYYGTFTITFGTGTDVYHYDDHTYQINGVEFTGTVTEFCAAVSPLFEGSEGGGEAYPDITENTTVEIVSTKVFNILDASAHGLLYLSSGATSQDAVLGDREGEIAEGPSSSIICRRNQSSGTGIASLDTRSDDYTTFASVTANSYETTAEVLMAAQFGSESRGLTLDQDGISFTGNGPIRFLNTNAIRLPNLSKAQRDAISSPQPGTAVYQTDNTPGLRIWNGSNWMAFTETADD
jgi:hypothetical protein